MALFYARCTEICPIGAMDVAVKEKLQIDMLVSFINKTLFHWQSQSTTSDVSKTGQRYIHHRAQGSKILLCVRDAKKDAWGGTASYSVLGFVDYVQHTGSNPMSITWRLAAEIPAKYIRQTNKLIVS